MTLGLTAAWRRWRAPLSVGVLDQGIASGANFLLNVALARWLPPAGYGAFAVAFAALLLISGPHSALLTDPLSVVGPRYFRGDTTRYLRALLVVHVALTVTLGALVAGAALLPVSLFALDRVWFVALGLSTPFVLSLWLFRSACYLEMRPVLALAGSVVYAVTLLALTAAAHRGAWLSPPTALLLMGGAAATASFAMAGALGLASGSWRSLDIPRVLREHWLYGRWILAASVGNAVANGLYVPLVGALVGLAQAAALRALQNLVTPLQQIQGGVAMVAYPFMARQVAEQGSTYVRRRGHLFVVLNVSLAAAYGSTLALLGHPLLAAIYGSGYYTGFTSLVPLFAVTAVAIALAQCLGILVRVINRPQAVLWAKCAAAAWLGGVGIALVRANGIQGAIVSLAGGASVEAAVLAFVLTRGVVGSGVSLPPSPAENVQ